MNLPEDIRDLCQAFSDGLLDALGEKLVGVYLYGALTFPETEVIGDIDFHAILAAPLSEAERSRLADMHQALAGDFAPLGGELDGYYILLADARLAAPPRSQMDRGAVDRAWALHREHIHAGQCIVLHGPDPTSIYPRATRADLVDALDAEMPFVVDHLDQYPDYCFLQLCRLVYSFETGNVVVSKSAAADWGQARFPQWRRHIAAAKTSYAHLTDEDRRFLLSGVRAFHELASEQIEAARLRAQREPS